MSKSIKDYISASQVTTFLYCPMQYKMIYVDGAKKDPPNMYMAYGSAIHEALADNYRQKIVSRMDLDSEEMIELFHMHFSKAVKEVPEKEWGLSGLLELQGEDMISKYMMRVAPTIQPLYVEKKFKVEVKSIGVTILGYMDVVDEDYVIIDHKGCGITTCRSFTQNYVDRMLQLTMYSLAFRTEYGFEEKGLRIDLLKRYKKGADFASITTTRDDAQVFSLLQVLSVMKHCIKNDIWFCNLSSCGNCLIPL